MSEVEVRSGAIIVLLLVKRLCVPRGGDHLLYSESVLILLCKGKCKRVGDTHLCRWSCEIRVLPPGS